jgi:hypothetical protein
MQLYGGSIVASSSNPTPEWKGRLSDPRLWLWVASIAILAALSVYAYMGIFSRYQADDYCLAWNGTTRPFLDAQTTWYKTDSSRYSATLVYTLSDKLGRWTVPALPAFVLAVWLAGTFWLVTRLQRIFHLDFPPIASLFIAELWLYFVLLLAPNLYQILYWRSGMVVYLLPLVFLTYLAVFLLAQVSNPSRKWRSVLAGLVILFFYLNGGFSETIATIQIGMLALTLVASLLFVKGEARKWILLLVSCALLGSILAMASLYFSPATRMRQGLIGPGPGLFDLVRMSLTNAFVFIYISLGESAFQLVILMLSAMLAGYTLYSARMTDSKLKPASLVSALFLLPVMAYLWIVCVCAPYAFGESAYPEARVLLDAWFILVAMIIGQGLVLGLSLGLLQQRSQELAPISLRAVSLLILVVLSLFPLYSSRKVWADLPDYRQRAQAWDGRDTQIRTLVGQGQQEITVTAYDSIAGLMELGPDPSMWVNGCAALYYGVRSITAELP